MIGAIFKYTTYLLLIFGLFFCTYKLGEMHGRVNERLHGEDVVVMTDCIESSLFSRCKLTLINSKKFVQLYGEIQKELESYQAKDIGGQL